MRTKDSKKIWLASPYMHEAEKKYVQKAFDANWITTAGENIDKLEGQVCEYTGAGYAVALSSGTAALHLAMIDAGVKAGDKVFCTDMTFAATVNPVCYQGAEPVFIDSEEETWNMDPQALKIAFARYPDVKVVVAANLYGVPAKLYEIRAICEEQNAVLIEDAAESFGAECKGKQTGTWGDYGVISFNGNKIITGSTGGMVITDDKTRADHIRKLATQAREPVSWYEHTEIGYNYRMSNIAAGIARGQMEHLDEHIAGKKAIFDRYSESFKHLPVKMHGGGNYWLSCMTIDDSAVNSGGTQEESNHQAMECCGRHEEGDHQAVKCDGSWQAPDRIIEALADCNVEARHIWKPMSMQPVFEGRDTVGSGVCERIFRTGICLPSDLNMTADEQQEVIEIVRRTVRG